MMNIDHVTIEKFSEISGYTVAAIQTKIDRLVWVVDEEYVRAPDGRILICLTGFEKWATNSKGFEPSKSPSTILINGVVKGSKAGVIPRSL